MREIDDILSSFYWHCFYTCTVRERMYQSNKKKWSTAASLLISTIKEGKGDTALKEAGSNHSKKIGYAQERQQQYTKKRYVARNDKSISRDHITPREVQTSGSGLTLSVFPSCHMNRTDHGEEANTCKKRAATPWCTNRVPFICLCSFQRAP